MSHRDSHFSLNICYVTVELNVIPHAAICQKFVRYLSKLSMYFSFVYSSTFTNSALIFLQFLNLRGRGNYHVLLPFQSRFSRHEHVKFYQSWLNPTLDENLSPLDVELLWRVSRLSCTLHDGGSRLRGGRAGHRRGLGSLKGFDSGAGQLDGSPLSDRNCVVSEYSYN